MTVLRTTPEFLAWLAANGWTERDLESPPVAFGLVALYEGAQRGTEQDKDDAASVPLV